MKAIVFGASGQFAQSLKTASQEKQISIDFVAGSDVDIRDDKTVTKTVAKSGADFLINVAAIHSKSQLDDSPGSAYEVNAIGSRNVAEASKSAQIPYVYVSTDFIFSGFHSSGYLKEDEQPDAKLNVYAETKILGEVYAMEIAHNPIVWRISSPFGPFDSKAKGKNFLNNVLERLSNNERVEVVDNIYMSPTYTIDSASYLLDLLDHDESAGIWHGSNHGRTSWFEFAKYAAENLGLPLPIPISSNETRDTSLSIDKLQKHLGLDIRSWQDAVNDFLRSKEHSAI